MRGPGAIRFVLPVLATVASITTTLPGQALGQVEFPTSANSAAAQDAFIRGVLLLHSFEYEDAREAFRTAQKGEPGFAMAHWGEALTFHHPIWAREEVADARKALARFAPTAAERRAKAPTDKEKAWLGTVEKLFGEGTYRQRWTAYADALAAMHARYPHDVEVAAFYSVAILGTAFDGRDFRIFMRAAAVAESFHRKHPDHPGLLHYLIHSYDDPVHAPLGLPMARRYDKIAPSAGHALHMPSHIYVALGMWQESIVANIASFAADDARRGRKKLGVDARGWHACQWLAYSYLQRGQFEQADKLLTEVTRDNEKSKTYRLRSHFVVMRASHLIETGNWSHPAGKLPVGLQELPRSVKATDCFVRAMVALAGGDVAGARKVLEEARKLTFVPSPAARSANGDAKTGEALHAAKDGKPTTPSGAACCLPAGRRPENVQDLLAARAVVKQIEGVIAIHAGRRTAGIEALRAACTVEHEIAFDFGPPVVAKPAHELLGEELLKVGEAAEAEKEFRVALKRAPRRSLSLLGLARALRAQKREREARAMYQELARIWRPADEGVQGSDEVRAAAR